MRMGTVRGMLVTAVVGLTFAATSARATEIKVNGDDSKVLLSGTSGNAILDATISGNASASSILILSIENGKDKTGTSSSFTLSQVPYTTIDGTRYFAFVYDAWEQDGGPQHIPVTISDITLTLNGIGPVWSANDSIRLNSATPYTSSHIGDGFDLAVFVPLSVFEGLDLTGSSTASLTVTQTHGHGQPDRWYLDGSIFSGAQFFGAGDLITSASSDPAVPEPTTFLLSGGVLIGAGLLLRRKRA